MARVGAQREKNTLGQRLLTGQPAERASKWRFPMGDKPKKKAQNHLVPTRMASACPL